MQWDQQAGISLQLADADLGPLDVLPKPLARSLDVVSLKLTHTRGGALRVDGITSFRYCAAHRTTVAGLVKLPTALQSEGNTMALAEWMKLRDDARRIAATGRSLGGNEGRTIGDLAERLAALAQIGEAQAKDLEHGLNEIRERLDKIETSK